MSSILTVLSLVLMTVAVSLAAAEMLALRGSDSIRRAVRDRRDLLAATATTAVRQELHRELEAAEPSIVRARDNPLAPAGDVLLFAAGEQVLPRPGAAAETGDSGARAIYEAIRQGNVALEEDGSPWSERLSLGLEVRGATYMEDPNAVEKAFRTLLAHRVRYEVPPQEDLPLTVGLVDFLVEHAPADPLLLAAVLRDGFSEAGSGTIEGLQPALLRARSALSTKDFDFLAGRITALSEAAGIIHDDFDARLKDTPGERLDLAGVTYPSLVNGWYCESREDGTIRGVRVNLDRILNSARRTLLSDHVLDAADAIALDNLPPRILPMGKLTAYVSSPELDSEDHRIERSFRVVQWSAALFLLGMAGVWAVAIIRSRRPPTLGGARLAALVQGWRSPLAALRRAAESLERRTDVDGEKLAETQQMLAEVNHLSATLENISASDRLDRRSWKPRRVALTVGDLLPAVRAEIQSWTRATVRLRAEGIDALTLEGDPDMLKLVFANLARNACQYSDRNPVELRITGVRSGQLHLRFADNGTGLAPETREAIFREPVRTEADLGVKGGIGLGLPLCRRIVELHGGTIHVATSGPTGTTFEVTLP